MLRGATGITCCPSSSSTTPGYNIDLGTHVFPARKYRLIRDGLVAKGIADPADILAPEPASDEDVLRVHTAEYVHKLKTGTLTASEQMRLELPFSQPVVDAFWLAAGGSILAAQCAMQDGFGINLGGGFHHAFPGHGEGFCMLNDVAIGIRRVQADGAARVMVVDVDVHQGNGTAYIFRDDDSVFTFSIHQARNYPEPKPPSDLDINLENGVGDEEYLRAAAPRAGRMFLALQARSDFLRGRGRSVPRRPARRPVADAGRTCGSATIWCLRSAAARRAGRRHVCRRLRAKHRRHGANPHEHGAGRARLLRPVSRGKRLANLSAENRSSRPWCSAHRRAR